MMSKIQIAPRTFPAEWQNAGAILMALPHPKTDWNYILDEAIDCWRRMIAAIVPHAKIVMLSPSVQYARMKIGDIMDEHPDDLIVVEAETNDTWTRDYGPLTMVDNGSLKLLDFTFNGWGLKFAANFDNQASRELARKKFWQATLENHLDFVLEGGSVDSNGNGLIMTTSECLLSPNRNTWLSKEEIAAHLKAIFGVSKILWIDHGYLAGDDTDSHVDTLARFAPNNQIVYVECVDNDDEHYQALEAMKRDIHKLTDSDDRPFHTIAVPLPDPIYDDDGNRLPATYANYLVLPDCVVMPTYNQPLKDKLASQILEIVYEMPVVTVDCRTLIKQHGSLHCSTMQIPVETLPL